MKCPGQDSRYWRPDAIFEAECSKCGHLVEFFKDDTWRKCPECGVKVPNPQLDFGCATYCPYAEQCVGSLPPEIARKRLKQIKEEGSVPEEAKEKGLLDDTEQSKT